ncbi:type II toxin-antitoxin system Phd/YefM family antitoxin [Anabaena sp. UHCC 0253]|uniref:type II toxin-antitoxin system Phd/YefM family antitoxin n=1 Tax=Anabaena sp. UHCC 0253 TaxID=2590019 RepID=UPI001446535C|nr:type II toxin-antitoxin system Phd/YefM family antitoxin [Anabaena sp. UHCC 0253]MTJ52264.1 type II toxin-antitoxin system Phd/YefM family antitoxin [Anabaena sp. UHCC 0253]
MTQVNATEVQEHLSDFLDSLTQGETSIVIEQAGKAIATLISYEEWKRLKQLESYLISEDDTESFTPEEVIQAYNQLHGTEFTVENIVNE